MRNPKRIKKCLRKIEEIWSKHPDLRLGQLILNVINDPALYYIEDEKLVELLENFYNNI